MCMHSGVWASLMAQLVKNLPVMQETQFDSWVRKIPWRKKRLPTPAFLGFPYDSAGKESTSNVEDLGLIPGLGRSSGDRKGYPLQYSGLENAMDCIVHGVTQSRTQLSDFHFHSGVYTKLHSLIENHSPYREGTQQAPSKWVQYRIQYL